MSPSPTLTRSHVFSSFTAPVFSLSSYHRIFISSVFHPPHSRFTSLDILLFLAVVSAVSIYLPTLSPGTHTYTNTHRCAYMRTIINAPMHPHNWEHSWFLLLINLPSAALCFSFSKFVSSFHSLTLSFSQACVHRNIHTHRCCILGNTSVHIA